MAGLFQVGPAGVPGSGGGGGMTAILALAALAVAAEFISSPAPIPGLPRITMGDVACKLMEGNHRG